MENIAHAQSHIQIKIDNQPVDFIVICKLYGDKFVDNDTIYSSDNSFIYEKPLLTGVYSAILGQTPIAKVMNEPPQQLDFIYNGVNIEIETDFKAPLDSAKVINSQENKIWFDYLKKERQYKNRFNELEMQIDYFQVNKNDAYYTIEKQNEIIDQFNRLQQSHQAFIDETVRTYSHLYASRLILSSQRPYQDGKLTKSERIQIRKEHCFDYIDFNDESLINSDVLTSKVFEYLMLNADRTLSREQQELSFQNAIDVIIPKVSLNKEVSVFIVDYLMRGFERLGMDGLLLYIAERYSPSDGCVSDNTLQRRLAFSRMKQGDNMPDISLSSYGGGQSCLADIKAEYKLIVFWETTCPSCKELLPKLRNWYFFKNVDLEVVAISIDKCEEDWQLFVTKNDYPWINLNEPHKWNGEVAKAFNLYATPTMFLLNKENRLIIKPMSMMDVVKFFNDKKM